MHRNKTGEPLRRSVLLLFSDAQIERPPRGGLSPIQSGVSIQAAMRAAASVSVREGLIYEIADERLVVRALHRR
jgi:hypothetical protein